MSEMTLDGVLETVEETHKNDWHATTVFEKIRMDENGMITGEGDLPFQALSMNHKSSKQLLSMLGLQKNFLERLTPDIYAPVVNRFLENHYAKGIQVRGNEQMIRGFVGPRYNPIDDLALARIMHELFSKNPDIRVKDFQLKDESFSLRLFNDSMALNEVGDLRGGIHVYNSEIGLHDTEITPFVERLACTNGMVVYMKDGENAKNHTDYGCGSCGKGYRRVKDAIKIDRSVTDPEEFRQAIIGYASTAMHLSEQGMNEFANTNNIVVNYPLALIKHLSKKEGFDEDTTDRVLDAWYQEQAQTKFSVINAFTATAKEMDGIEKHDMEAFAGDLVFSCLPEEKDYLDN